MSKEVIDMFKNKSEAGNNLCGKRIAELRKAKNPKMSQRMLADKLQLMGLDIDKNAVQRIECGKRFVTDIEIASFSELFGVSCDYLINGKK
jgi:transcriptional regulator with XRE-family HTH domain